MFTITFHKLFSELSYSPQLPQSGLQLRISRAICDITSKLGVTFPSSKLKLVNVDEKLGMVLIKKIKKWTRGSIL